ncbi:hypothetical protein LBMAG40_10410 [Cyanobium sp.]|jgi:hypothetical protein|nr:hypothetical protein LBMAG40_10410 [Cyanobium sp.]
MDQPIWLLVPWLVFAIAAVLKAWKIGRLINNRLINNQLHSQRRDTAGGLERFRAELELGWQRSQQSAQNKELS